MKNGDYCGYYLLQGHYSECYHHGTLSPRRRSVLTSSLCQQVRTGCDAAAGRLKLCLCCSSDCVSSISSTPNQSNKNTSSINPPLLLAAPGDNSPDASSHMEAGSRPTRKEAPLIRKFTDAVNSQEHLLTE